MHYVVGNPSKKKGGKFHTWRGGKAGPGHFPHFFFKKKWCLKCILSHFKPFLIMFFELFFGKKNRKFSTFLSVEGGLDPRCNTLMVCIMEKTYLAVTSTLQNTRRVVVHLQKNLNPQLSMEMELISRKPLVILVTAPTSSAMAQHQQTTTWSQL